MMPFKLVKLAVNYLDGRLSQSNNNSVKKELFPENEKASQSLA